MNDFKVSIYGDGKVPHFKRLRIRQALLFLLLFAIILPPPSFSASLKLKTIQAVRTLNLVLEIDKVENLAGLKVSVTYPDNSFKYESATKTKSTSSFMHVVNDKVPGKLTIVMASAQGISGSDVALIDLKFTFLQDNMEIPQPFSITACQLMTESLKELPCITNMSPQQ